MSDPKGSNAWGERGGEPPDAGPSNRARPVYRRFRLRYGFAFVGERPLDDRNREGRRGAASGAFR
jgi:hypothetical protein